MNHEHQRYWRAATFTALVSASLALAGCTKTEGRVCSPTSHWNSPSYRCVSSAAAPAPVEAQPEEKESEVEETPKKRVSVTDEKIEILERVQFEVNEAELLSESKQLLDEVAAIMNRHPEITKLRVEGHTDSTGDRQQNMELSEQRAQSVRTYLIEQGIEAKRLTARGFGPTSPIADNDTEEGRLQNRRVEFRIIEKDLGQ